MPTPDYRFPGPAQIDPAEFADLKALLKRLVIALEKIAEKGNKP